MTPRALVTSGTSPVEWTYPSGVRSASTRPHPLDRQILSPRIEIFSPYPFSSYAAAMAFTSTYAIRFADVDHARILYFPNFLHYFHCTFEDFFEHACGFHYNRVLNEHRIGFPAVHINVDFRSPLRFGDHVAITLDVRRIGHKSATFGYTGRRVETEELCVEGEIITAVINMDTFKPIELPSQYRQWFEQHLAPETGAKR